MYFKQFSVTDTFSTIQRKLMILGKWPTWRTIF